MAGPEVGAAGPTSAPQHAQQTFPARATAPNAVSGGPCAPARAEVDARCADAERLTVAAQGHQQALRDARREHGDGVQMRDNDATVRDRRRIAEQKAEAQAEYHATVLKASDQATLQDAAAAWLRRIDQLNRHARIADERADGIAQRVRELERALPGLELAADAARIVAEAAQVSCLEARRALAACEEETQRLMAGGATDGQSPSANGYAAGAGPAPIPAPPWSSTGQPAAYQSPSPAAPPPVPTEQPADIERAARALMRGDRQLLLGLALRLSEETGFEAGRMQLLLLELREQISDRALQDMAIGFPADHPFWSQFTSDNARAIAISLASMGYHFDGQGGWTDGRVPQVRDLALALSYCGHDPRSLRRPAGQAALDALWQGTTLRSEEYLLARAPDLALTQVVAFLGPRSGRLAELWDMWGRLRPLLMRAGTNGL